MFEACIPLGDSICRDDKRDAVYAVLVEGLTMKEAAELCGVHIASVRRWCEDVRTRFRWAGIDWMEADDPRRKNGNWDGSVDPHGGDHQAKEASE